MKLNKLVPLLFILSTIASSRANTLSWSGGGTSGNWSDSGNWGFAGVPGNGDTVVFPAPPSLVSTTNNLVGLSLAQIRFAGNGAGYTIYGNALTLTAGIEATNTLGGNIINNGISVGPSGITVDVGNNSYLTLGGMIQGSTGVTKIGVGTLIYAYSGSNPYTGTTKVNAGTLQLNVGGINAYSGPLIIGDGSGTGFPVVQLLQSTEMPDSQPVTVNLNGVLNFNNFSDIIGPLTIQGATVETGSGTLSLNGDLTVLGSGTEPTITGNLHFIGGMHVVNVADGPTFRDLDLLANVSDAGGGLLFTNNAPSDCFAILGGNNSFTGPLIIDNMTLSVQTPTGLGTAASGTTVGSHGELFVYSTGITNESLTMMPGAILYAQDDCVWAGPIVLNGDVTIGCYPSVSTFIIPSVISGVGGFEKIDVGTLELFGNSGNTYTGNTYIQSGTCLIDKASGTAIPGGTLTIGDHLGTFARVMDLNVGANLGSTIALAINEQGVLDLNNEFESVGPISLSGGTIATGSGRLQINGDVTCLASTNNATIYGSALFAGGLRTIAVNHGYAPGAWDLLIPGTLGDTGAGLQFVQGLSNSIPGVAYVRLMGSNSFTGPLTIGGLSVDAETPWALGATTSGTFLTNAGSLFLYAIGITNETVTLAAGTTLGGEWAGTSAVWAGPIVLLGDATIYGFNIYGLFDVLGAISGTGNLTVAGDGELVRFSGSLANTYTGTTTVAGSENYILINSPLLLNRTGVGNAIPGPLIINSNCVVQELLDWQLNSPTKPVTIQETGVLDLTNHNDWIGPLTLKGAQVTTGTGGTLYLGGDITVNSSTVATSKITGNASLWNGTRTINCAGHNFSPDFTIQANLSGNSSSGIIKTGPGEASLAGVNNTFPGPTTVNAGSLWVAATNALGNTNTPATVNTNGNLFLDGNVAIGLKPLNLNGPGGAQGALVAGFGTGRWGGTVTFATNVVIDVYTNSTLELSGAITGSGNLTKIDWGNLLLDGAASNTFAGATLLQQGMMTLSKTNGPALPGSVTIGAGLDGPNADILKILQPNQLAQTSAVNIASSGLFDVTLGSITRAGSIAGSGSVQMGSSMLMFGYDNSSSVFGGSISGSADLTKVGTGTWTYTGTGSYAGNFGINSGQVFVDGSLASAAIFFYAGTTFGGNGSVGPITSGNGLLSVGDNNPGILNSGSLSLASGDTFLAYINGTTAGSGYSQMGFSGGTISLNNAHLQLNMSVLGATNNHYTLIHNPTLHVISGTFSGLAEGATVAANNGVHFTITYHGGPTGNDVVLTQTSLATPPNLTGITHLTNGNVTITGTGAPNVTYRVQANSDLTKTNWINLGPITADNLGALMFTDAQAALYAERFYRFVYP